MRLTPSGAKRRSYAARRGFAALVLLTLALLTACSAATPGPAPDPGSDPPEATALPTPTSTGGRPLLGVPDVRPAGFADPPPGTGLPRYTGQRPDWQPCGRGLRCATVLVPLDYDDPDRTAITLSLAERPATGSDHRGALFLNPGGPGGSGVDLVRGLDPEGLTDFDLIGWDPRGVGASTPATCFGGAALDRFNAVDDSPDDAVERQALLDTDRSFGASCLARSGVLLEHISTAETVRDLDLLRQLVGAPKLNYLGFSYGTLIGALYAQDHPDRVGRMVLDGATDITGGRSVSQLSGFERAFAHFATWCGGQPCGLGGSPAEVRQTVLGFLTGLDDHPLVVGRRALSQQQAVQAVFTALYGGRRGWARLAPALRAALDGNGAALLAQADAADDRQADGSYSSLAYGFPTVRCRDSQAVSVAAVEQTAAAEDRSAPVLAPVNGPDYLCTQWPVPPAPKRPRITAAGAPPIVVVGTTGDPATPYEWAQAMAGQLASGVLLTYAGEGHTAYGQSGCVRRLVQHYLLDAVPPAAGTRCSD